MSNNTTSSQHKLRTKLILIYLIVFGLKIAKSEKDNGNVATFHFPEYAYKENGKNALAYRGFETACELGMLCKDLENVERIQCIRKCISPSCYQDIYAFDELEEGEIDVRLNSFKGCVIQRSGKTNRI